MTAAPDTPRFPANDEVEGFWTWDKIHAPRPLTPLSGDTVLRALPEGFSEAMREYDCSLAMEMTTFNYYAYASFHPVDADRDSGAEREARYGATLDRIVPRVGRLWQDEWLPSILPGLEKAKNTDYAGLSDDELWQQFEEHLQALHYRWMIHGRINFVLIAASWFIDYYNELFNPEDKVEAYQMLQGHETRSVAASRELWRLSRFVRGSEALSRLFRDMDPSELADALDQSEEGRAFVSEFRTFLDEFGWRSDAVYDLADKPWREEPSIPLNTLQGYIALDDGSDPDIQLRNSIQRRETLLAQTRERLASRPQELARFEELYEAARWDLPLTEDHAFYIDQMGVVLMRLPVLEIGRRLVDRGCLEAAEDVFMLHLDELRDTWRESIDRRELARARRAEMAHWATVVPPLAIGRPPPPSDDPFAEALFVKMFGAGQTPEPDRDPDVVVGIPASRGTARGTAKVVRSLSEASKLQQGDIMVCEMTLPPWVPLFATVSGLVADTGGVLSHCAIVAREYHLPAVVGTNVGTSAIKDGMTVTVDGTKGVVRIDAR